MGSEMCTTALACTDALLSEAELANGNTAGTFGYQKLDEHKLSYLSSALRQKFDSPSFEIQLGKRESKNKFQLQGQKENSGKAPKKTSKTVEQF